MEQCQLGETDMSGNRLDYTLQRSRKKSKQTLCKWGTGENNRIRLELIVCVLLIFIQWILIIVCHLVQNAIYAIRTIEHTFINYVCVCVCVCEKKRIIV